MMYVFVVNSEMITYNAALNRTAYQSSVHSDSRGTSYPAHYANDGSRHTRSSTAPYCAVTNNEVNPWWAVDLGQPMTIYKVDLTTSRYIGRKTNIIGFLRSVCPMHCIAALDRI